MSAQPADALCLSRPLSALPAFLFSDSVRGSSQGAFNSWDRLPYITEIRDGKTPSTIPAWNNMHHNFIVANYAADGGCLDNDDGSSYYDIHHNYCVFGGHVSAAAPVCLLSGAQRSGCAEERFRRQLQSLIVQLARLPVGLRLQVLWRAAVHAAQGICGGLP